jgi:hypothetical protein
MADRKSEPSKIDFVPPVYRHQMSMGRTIYVASKPPEFKTVKREELPKKEEK